MQESHSSRSIAHERENISVNAKTPEGCKIANLKIWCSQKALEEIAQAGYRNLVILVSEPARTGDFPALLQSMSLSGSRSVNTRQRIYTLVKGRGRTKTTTVVEVRKGSLPTDPSRPWKELENRPENQNAICIVSSSCPEKLRRALNKEMARRSIFSRPIEEHGELFELDEIVPWTEIPEPGMEVVVLKNHPKFRLGTRWTIREVHDNGSLVLAKARVQKTFSRDQLSQLEEHLSLVQRTPMRIVPGLKLQAEHSFYARQPAVAIRAGEIIVPRKVDSNGDLILDDGRRVPPRFRAFSPAFFLRTVPHAKGNLDTVLVQDPNSKKKREWALSMRARKLIVFCEHPESFAEALGKEQAIQKAKLRMQAELQFVSGEGSIVPHFSTWGKLWSNYRLSKQKAKVSAVFQKSGPDNASKTPHPLPAGNTRDRTADQRESKQAGDAASSVISQTRKLQKSKNLAKTEEGLPEMS